MYFKANCDIAPIDKHQTFHFFLISESCASLYYIEQKKSGLRVAQKEKEKKRAPGVRNAECSPIVF